MKCVLFPEFHNMEQRHGKAMVRAIAFLCLFLCFMGYRHAYSENGNCLDFRVEIQEAGKTVTVYPQEVGDGLYCFLPSTTDLSAICIRSDHDLLLLGRDGEYIRCNDGPVDLISLYEWEDMKSGEKYAVHMKNDSVGGSVCFFMLGDIPSLHLELEEPISVLHKNKDNKVKGSLVILHSGKAPIFCDSIRIKGRGNASWNTETEKKPYNISLAKSAELINGAGPAKDWCLIANNEAGDTSGLANIVASHLYNSLGGKSALSYEMVDLYLNGSYRGMYMLSEKPEIQPDRIEITKCQYSYEDRNTTRIIQPQGITNEPDTWDRLETNKNHTEEISRNPEDDPALSSGIQAYQYTNKSKLISDGGYLLEINLYFYDENCWFITKRGVAVSIKEPKCATKEQVQRIAVAVQQFEDALYAESGINDYGDRYNDYVDEKSLVIHFLLDCCTLNGDMMATSFFFYTELDETNDFTPFVFSPAWDYNWLLYDLPWYYSGRVGQNHPSANQTIWAEQLIKKGDYMAKVYAMSESALKPVWEELNELGIDSIINSSRGSGTMNQMLWGEKYDFGTNSMRVKNHFSERYHLWYTQFYSQDNLLGVRAVREGETIKAIVNGKGSGYQWYSVDDDYTVHPIENATDAEYSPGREGLYLVAVTGNNPVYSAVYEQDGIENWTRNGDKALGSYKTILMYSNTLYFPEQPD